MIEMTENFTGKKNTTLLTRFENKIIPITESGCWIWLGICCKKGYGRISVNGRNRPTHRLSYEMYIGKIGSGLCVCHKCDTPECVNPAHLFLGTVQQNNKDRDVKNRTAKGESKSDLTSDVVLKIYHSPGTHKEIARKYGIRTNRVTQIKCGNRWSHVTKRKQV